MSFFFLFCTPSYVIDARVASSSSSSFLIQTHLPLLPALVNILSSWCRRASHISSQLGRVALPKMIWKNVSQSSETTFRAVLTMNSRSSVDPTEVSWSRIPYNLRRNGSMFSPFYIWYDLSWFSNNIFCCTEECWYMVVNIYHISLVVLFSAICGITWSLTLSRIMHFSFAWASSYISFASGSTRTSIVFKA